MDAIKEDSYPQSLASTRVHSEHIHIHTPHTGTHLNTYRLRPTKTLLSLRGSGTHETFGYRSHPL